jgi:hypothetical protein
MNDKELLYLAAKAAGIEVVTPTMLEYGKWNPLEDDGDALRLAVKLGLGIVFTHGRIIVGLDGKCIAEDEEGNTRRAIVRAAAEIGKAMP